jgi:hypothetical protein
MIICLTIHLCQTALLKRLDLYSVHADFYTSENRININANGWHFFFSIIDHKCPYETLVDRSRYYRSTAGKEPFHVHFRIWFILIVEDPTVTMKCKISMKSLFLFFNFCLSEMLDSLSCQCTSFIISYCCSPMDIYETRNRLSFVAAFVAISYLCFEVILDNRLIIQFSGDVGVKGQNKYYYTTTNIIVKSQVLVLIVNMANSHTN